VYTDAPSGQLLHFRGWRILNAVFVDLIEKYDFSSSTDVILGGGSAGALAVYLHADTIRELYVPTQARFMAMPDAGFFREYNVLCVFVIN
jgi:hypothetical protein